MASANIKDDEVYGLLDLSDSDVSDWIPDDEELDLERPDDEEEPQPDEPTQSQSNAPDNGTPRPKDGGPTTSVPFKPERVPGLHLPDCQTRQDIQKFWRPVDFFKLYFTSALVQLLCEWTNAYADSVGEQRKSMYERWTKVDEEEF
ncbi:hypothetical protein ElyMa_001738800 [Elysia marginata]|uniref:PiggyBac transposable element-derived protein domain-containing protein n=1 Tax=Elysia marginata TaxID=1093978 RepID=A0AAV4JWD1_9GAST|nr:hypothetical protein ElyMa_001738800 [Elysia marginata]